MMNIDDLTLGQIKQINLFTQNNQTKNATLNSMIGKKVIIRTYSAGVHFGELVEKSGEEVILKNSRRMYEWKTKKGITLSAVALDGLDEEKSRLTASIESIWLKAIEIIPCSESAIESIEGCVNVQVE